jgi:hypothetical protein
MQTVPCRACAPRRLASARRADEDIVADEPVERASVALSHTHAFAQLAEMALHLVAQSVRAQAIAAGLAPTRQPPDPRPRPSVRATRACCRVHANGHALLCIGKSVSDGAKVAKVGQPLQLAQHADCVQAHHDRRRQLGRATQLREDSVQLRCRSNRQTARQS